VVGELITPKLEILYLFQKEFHIIISPVQNVESSCNIPAGLEKYFKEVADILRIGHPILVPNYLGFAVLDQ
jgi:hypothetical protein